MIYQSSEPLGHGGQGAVEVALGDAVEVSGLVPPACDKLFNKVDAGPTTGASAKLARQELVYQLGLIGPERTGALKELAKTGGLLGIDEDTFALIGNSQHLNGFTSSGFRVNLNGSNRIGTA
jgi:hypothetical protein